MATSGSSFVIAGFAGGLMLTFTDFALTLFRGPRLPGVSEAACLGVSLAWCAPGIAAGWIASLLFGRPARRPAVRDYAGAALLALPFAWRAESTLFRGAWASRLPMLPLWKAGCALLVVAGALGVARLCRRGIGGPGTTTIVRAALGAGLVVANLRLFPGQYPAAHEMLLAAVLVIAMAIACDYAGSRQVRVGMATGAALLLSSVALFIPELSPLDCALARTWTQPVAGMLRATKDDARSDEDAAYNLAPWSQDTLSTSLATLRQGGLPPRPSMLFVTIDALRIDRVGTYGCRRKLTPVIDGLAEKGLSFSQARAAATHTMWSVLAFLTARRPDRIAENADPDSLRTLPEELEPIGYRTYGSFPRWAVVPPLEWGRGFTRADLGFETCDGEQMSDRERVTRYLSFARTTSDHPSFAWIHFMGPHAPYAPAAGPVLGESPEDRYDQEVREADALLGELLDAMRGDAALKDTVVIVSADHGEEFGEHGVCFHGLSVYEHAVHVPLVLAGPGIPARRCDAQVSLTDLLPTCLHLAGADPIPDLGGRSLIPVGLGIEAGADRVVFINQRNAVHEIALRAAVFGRHKAILDDRTGRMEIHDIVSDPVEAIDLSRSSGELAAALRRIVSSPPPKDRTLAQTERKLSAIRRLAYSCETSFDYWEPFLVDAKPAIRLAALDALAAMDKADKRTTLRAFAAADGPASDAERLRALAIACRPPSLADLEHPDDHFRLATVRGFLAGSEAPPAAPFAARLSRESNRDVCFELLRGLAWAKNDVGTDLLATQAGYDDPAGVEATRIILSKWAAAPAATRPGIAIVGAQGAGPENVGDKGVAINVPALPPEDGAGGEPWRNWLVFLVNDDLARAGCFATSAGRAHPASVHRIESTIAISVARARAPLRIEVFGDTQRPTFIAAVRVPIRP